MGDKIKAGIVCVTKFCSANDDKFTRYIDYITRDNASRAKNVDKYNLFDNYLDYVHDTKKTSNLFTKFTDRATAEEKSELKDIFELAQKNESPMWQTVISFDNRFLENMGIYDSQTHSLNEARLVAAARKAIDSMLKQENLENAIYAASIHYNTDNIHIHVATVEPYPSREKELYRQYATDENGKFLRQYNPQTKRMEKIPLKDENGDYIYKEEFRGKFKESSLNGKNGLKSVLLSELADNSEVSTEITSIIRNMVMAKKSIEMGLDSELGYKLYSLYDKLKGNVAREHWQYKNKHMKDFKADIDQLSLEYINNYHSDEFERLQELLQARSDFFKQAYGDGKKDIRDYSMNEMENELLYRMGNAILKELREYDLQKKKADQISMSKFKESLHQDIDVNYNPAIYDFKNAWYHLKRSLKECIDECIAMAEFNKLQFEIAKRGYSNEIF